jgi:hypothetical protein
MFFIRMVDESLYVMAFTRGKVEGERDERDKKYIKSLYG